MIKSNQEEVHDHWLSLVDKVFTYGYQEKRKGVQDCLNEYDEIPVKSAGIYSVTILLSCNYH